MNDESSGLTIGELDALEHSRCRAISTGDWKALRDLLHDDYIYGFLSGRLESKSTYLSGLPSRPHEVTCEQLRTTVYGDMAVMIGMYRTKMLSSGEMTYASTAIEVWLRSESGDWKLVTTHTTAIDQSRGLVRQDLSTL